MRKHLKRIRKTSVTKNEIIADLIFLGVSGLLSFLIVFLFDIHHTFYSWPMKLKFIFETKYPYFLFTSLGAVIGFINLKLILVGIKKELK